MPRLILILATTVVLSACSTGPVELDAADVAQMSKMVDVVHY